jgi:hypothetical protein
MKKIILSILLTLSGLQLAAANNLPVRGLYLNHGASVADIITLIEEELAPAGFNMLILGSGWSYEYQSHPELHRTSMLRRDEVKQILAACRRHGITLVPELNLFGHQSSHWGLLKAYPQFDETPWINEKEAATTDNFKDRWETSRWYDPGFFYCKSYCPLHPDLHRVLFDLIDELVDVFETKLFHAGMDEITIIGDEHCPRCHDHDPAELYAGEVTAIHDHLQARGVRMMIWGDRLIDARATGDENPFDASMNGTARAIDLIPKDIFICDWHYGKAMLTPLLFAMKGFDVASCSSHNIDVAHEQIDNMHTFRRNTNGEPRSHFQGLIHTIWGSRNLMETYRSPAKKSDVSALKELVDQFRTAAPLQKRISPSYRTAGEPQFADLAPWKEMIEAISWTGGTPSKRFVDNCHAAGISVYLTVSQAPGMSPQQVRAFVDSCLGDCSAYGYDGIELNFESLADGERDRYSFLVTTLADRLHALGKGLWQAVPSSELKYLDAAVIDRCCDRIRVMDSVHNAGEHDITTLGPVSPHGWTAAMMIGDWVSQFTKSKIVWSLPSTSNRYRIPKQGGQLTGTPELYTWKPDAGQKKNRAAVQGLQVAPTDIPAGVTPTWLETVRINLYEWETPDSRFKLYATDARSTEEALKTAEYYGFLHISFQNLAQVTPEMWEAARQFCM